MIRPARATIPPADAPVFLSWSTGKDSAWALQELRRRGCAVRGLLTSSNAEHERVAMHGVRNRLLELKVSEQDLKAIDAEVREIVNAAADFAQSDPEPDVSELYTDVYR